MMATQRQKEKRKIRVVAGSKFLQNQQRKGPNCLVLPSGLNLFDPKKDTTYALDFIPYQVGKNHPSEAEGEWYVERKYTIHWTLGASDNKAFTCLKNFGKRCPVCVYRDRMALDPKKADVVKALRAKERQMFLVYDTENPKKGVQLWDVAPFNFGEALGEKIKRARPKDRPRYEAFYDPYEGMTLHIGASEKNNQGIKFLSFHDIEFKEREAPIPEEILEHGICLDDIIKEYDYEELKKIFFDIEVSPGEEGDEEEEPDHDRPPPAASRNGRAAKAVEEEEEPEEEEESEEEEEEEEEEPAPKKGKPAPAKGGKKKATPVDDDDDDWGGDDDEPFDGEEAEEESEDEEPPKRPGKKPGGKKPRG